MHLRVGMNEQVWRKTEEEELRIVLMFPGWAIDEMELCAKTWEWAGQV